MYMCRYFDIYACGYGYICPYISKYIVCLKMKIRVKN